MDKVENLKFPWNFISIIEFGYFENYLGISVDLHNNPEVIFIKIGSSLNEEMNEISCPLFFYLHSIEIRIKKYLVIWGHFPKFEVNSYSRKMKFPKLCAIKHGDIILGYEISIP